MSILFNSLCAGLEDLLNTTENSDAPLLLQTQPLGQETPIKIPGANGII